MSTIERISRNKLFGGYQDVYRHQAQSLSCPMNFAVYSPPQAEHGRCPALYWLSGLTCTEQNFITKAGAQRFAAEYGIILIAPDTSPRGEAVADDPAYDLGQGAGFYVNASQAPWASHYRMDDYIVQELPELLGSHFPVTEQRGIFGHSMGGHGALTIALRNPGHYQSVSAFAPIVAPMQCPWGEKAFRTYLGDDRSQWQKYDATELIATSSERLPILIDQGDADEFLESQLRPDLFATACKQADYPLTLRLQPGYDHSYYFMASFISDHILHHARAFA